MTRSLSLRCSAPLLAAVCGSLSAAEPRPLMRDFIGINGHTVQFKPELYRPVCEKARDYHPVAWDLEKETSAPAPFPFAKNKVDWSKVYGSWKEKGWETDACLMFESIPQADWKNMEADAKAYGQSFAKEFGPSGARKLVTSVEIGNEPGKWSDADYTRIFKAMAAGVREGDPKLKIATCNMTTGPSGGYEKNVGCVGGSPELYDILNVHSYAQLENWPTWRRSFPEDPALPHYLKDIDSLCQWRDKNAPGKPVWITEFGYDSTTQPQEKSGDFAKWVGVTDEQQAQWIVRSLLVFSAMPVDRAFIYFFNDEDKASLHASAGLTRHFQPKPSFHAVSHLYQTLGDFRFSRIITNEPGKLRVQEYQHSTDAEKKIWAVWSPTADAKPTEVTLASVPGKLVSATRMPLTDVKESPANAKQAANGSVTVETGTSPVYLLLKVR
ncbi:MAG: cellulase family glycosylhydrolase [Luteolibacter sp.]